MRRFLTYDRDRFMVARLDAGDRQVDVAHAFGVSQATVSYTRGRLERRRRAPRIISVPNRTSSGSSWVLGFFCAVRGEAKHQRCGGI